MIATFRSFVKAKKPSYAQAVTSLRLTFVAMVFAQTLLALLVSVEFAARSAPNRASPFMGIILLLMALMQLPIGAALAETLGQKKRQTRGTGSHPFAGGGVVFGDVVCSLCLAHGRTCVGINGVCSHVCSGVWSGFGVMWPLCAVGAPSGTARAALLRRC